MIDYIELEQIKSLIEENNNFIITTHATPDGDAIGSSVGLCSYLKEIGKKAKIINCDPTPSHLKYIDINNHIEVFDENTHKKDFDEVDLILILDLNNSKRMNDLGKYLNSINKTKIVLDHHLEPEEFATHYYKDTDIASTSEIVYELITLFEKDYNFETAQAIYTGIITDTGSFAFDRTTPKTHLKAADLINHGVKPEEISDRIYNSKDINSLHLYGDALRSIELYNNDSFAIMTITQDVLNSNNKNENELEGFSVAPLRIDSVKSAVTIVETSETGKFKLSFRAKKGYGIRNIAVKLGGGGHELAAGARVSNTTLKELKELILSELEIK